MCFPQKQDIELVKVHLNFEMFPVITVHFGNKLSVPVSLRKLQAYPHCQKQGQNIKMQFLIDLTELECKNGSLAASNLGNFCLFEKKSDEKHGRIHGHQLGTGRQERICAFSHFST